MDEFVAAVLGRWPKAVLQFEDFNQQHARPLLERSRDNYLVFNDDIQVNFDPILIRSLPVITDNHGQGRATLLVYSWACCVTYALSQGWHHGDGTDALFVTWHRDAC